MRSLLSAARRTGVLGKSNAAHRHPAGFLPTRRMPSVGLGFPIVSSLLEAKTTSSSDRLHDAICRPHRRQQRRLTPQRATAPSAASPASAPSDSNAVSFGDLSDPAVVANYTGLQLLFLGTGAGPSPTRGRGAPCVAVRTPHASWLFDCGDDSQRALVRQLTSALGGGGGLSSSPLRHGRISAFFVTSRFNGGALGLPGMLCIASASRDAGTTKNPVGPVGTAGAGGLPPTSVSVFGPPGIANFLNEMLTLSDTYLAMPVLVHEFGFGVPGSGGRGGAAADDGSGRDALASMVSPSPRGKGAVPVPRPLSRRSKLSVATLLPDELNPFGFYDLERAPKIAALGVDSDGFDRAKKGRTIDKREGDRVGFGYGFDARSGIREPDCLPGPGDPARAVNGLLRDPATATWTLRFDREFVVRCVPLIAPSAKEEETEKMYSSSPLSASAATFTSAPGPDALGYVIRESARAGKIDAELAVSMGVTRGPMMAELKAGRSVTVTVPPSALDDDSEASEQRQQRPVTRVVRPEEVVSPERPGRVVAILGDPLPPRSDAETLFPSSSPRGGGGGGGDGGEGEEEKEAAAAALSAVVEAARGADLVVAGAASAAAAAKVADRAGASALVLTRFGKGDPSGRGEVEGASGGESGSESGSESGGEKQQQLRRTKRYADEDVAAEAEAVLAAREAAPRLSAKVAAARDLDMVVLSRREA